MLGMATKAKGPTFSELLQFSKMLKIVYDIKLWIADHAEELHEHTVPNCFKFELNEEGKAIMHYRNWSHAHWQGPIVMQKVSIKHT